MHTDSTVISKPKEQNYTSGNIRLQLFDSVRVPHSKCSCIYAQFMLSELYIYSTDSEFGYKTRFSR